MGVPYNFVFFFKVGLGIFFCEVGKICAMLAQHLQQLVIIKKLTSSKWKLPKSDAIQMTLGFFLCNVIWSLLSNIARVFACAMLSQDYYHIIEQDFFMWKCFLEALGQHCTRFLHLQCCPKTINPLMPSGNKKVTDTVV